MPAFCFLPELLHAPLPVCHSFSSKHHARHCYNITACKPL